MNKQNKQRIVQFGVLVIIVGLLVLGFSGAHWVQSLPQRTHDNTFTPQLSQGETASVTVGQNYYVNTSEASPSQVSSTLSSIEATSQQTVSTNLGSSAWNLYGGAAGYEDATVTLHLGNYQYWSGTSIGIQDWGFLMGISVGNNYNIGTVYMNLSIDKQTYYWSYTFNGYVPVTDPGDVYVNPTWSPSVASGYYPVNITVVLTPDTGMNFGGQAPYYGFTSTNHNSNVWSQNQPTDAGVSVPFMTGWTYSGVSWNPNLAIPEYTTAYQLLFTASQSSNFQYANSAGTLITYTVSGNLQTGWDSLTSVSLTVVINGDPNTPTVSASYQVNSLYKAITTTSQVTQSPAYTITNPSSNEFTSSFSFSQATNSSAFYGKYISNVYNIPNSFPTTANGNDVYSVSVGGLAQLYPTAQQNYWAYSVSGSNTIGTTQQSSASTHSFSFSNTQTTSGTPSWTVSTTEYANNNPSVVSSHLAYAGTGSEVKLYFNLSTPIFTGETQTIQITWGDGNSTTLTSTSNYNFLATHNYQFTGNYLISVSTSNTPSPSGSGGLSSLDAPTQTYKYNVQVTPSISPISGNAVTSGSVFSLSYSQTNDFVSQMWVNETANGVTNSIINDQFTTSHAGQTFTFQPSYAGLYNFILTVTFDGAKAVYQYSYTTPLYPTNNSNFLVVQYGKTSISGLQLTVTNPSSASTGNYLQQVALTPAQLNNANNSGFTNIAFYYTNGTIIYSWLEDVYQLQGSSQHAQGIWWLKLNPIPAGGSVIINVEVVIKIESLMNGVTIGEAPQLSPIYGQYNNLAYLTPYMLFTPYQMENVSLSGTIWSTPYLHPNSGVIFSNHTIIIINMTLAGGGIMTFGPYIGGNNLFGTGTYNNMFAVKGNATSGTFTENFHSDQVAPNNWNNTMFYAPTNNNTWIYNSYFGSIWNISSSAQYQFYNQQPSASVDARLCVNESILFKWSDALNASMPTVSITGTSDQFANSTQLNNVHYTVAQAYQYNTTEWEYTYNIANNGSNYITVYYAPSWQFQYGSPSSYISYTDIRAITFSDMSSWSLFQVNFIEPITIANPYGLLTINYAPSTAIGQVAGIKIPFSELTTYVNGQQMPTDQYQYVIGSNLNIVTKDTFNQTVANVNITPQGTTYSDFITIPVSQLQIANLNTTYYVSVYIKQNGIFQALTTVMPLQTVTDYLLSGTYNFSYRFTSINSNAATPATYSQKMNINGLAVTFFNGMLFYGINQNLSAQRHNLSSLMTNITVTIDANNATIANLLTSLNVNVNANDSTITNLLTYIKSQTTEVNSNVTNLYNQVLTNFTIVNSLIHNENVSIQTKMNFINTTLDSVNLNITNKIKYVNTLINSTNNTIINQLSIINSTLTHANLNITNKIKFTDSLLNNTNISIFNKIKYTDTIMNNTNFSIHNILNIENDTLNNVNLNITNKIKFTNSLLNNTNISIETKIGIVNTTLNAVNLNITTKIKYVDSLMNNTNVSITTKIGIVNDTLNNVNFNITTKIKYTNSLMNNTNISIQTKLGIVNDTLNNVNFNITTKINFVSNLINETGTYGTIPIKLTTQTPSTGTYQQLINMSQKGTSINNGFSNIQFKYGNGTRIYAWIQSISGSAGHEYANIWLKLYSDVNQTIYLKVYPQSDNFLSATGYVGEAPQLSSTYAEYDNGHLVFDGNINQNFYTNFSGSFNLSANPNIQYDGVSLINKGTTGYAIINNGLIFVNATYVDISVSSIDYSKNTEPLISYAYVGSYSGNHNNYLRWFNATEQQFVGMTIPNLYDVTTSELHLPYTSLQIQPNNIVNQTIDYLFSMPYITMPTTTIGSQSNSSEMFKINTILNIINSTLNSNDINIQNRIAIVNSSLNNVNTSISNKLAILNTTLGNVNVNITNKIAFTNALLNNTNISIQSKLSVINSVLNNVNTNITTKIQYTDSLMNNTKLTITNKISILNATLNSLNINLTSKIKFVNSLINSSTINVLTKIGFVNTTLNNVNISVSTKFKYVDSLVNNTEITITTKLGIINSTLNNVNINITNKIKFTNSLLNNTNLSIQNKLTTINSVLTNVNVNITNKIKFTNSLLNSTTLSISNKIGIVNTTLNSVNLNITTKIKYVNSLVNSTTLNIDTKIGILNSTLNNVNINITNKIKFTNSLLNNTNLSIQNKLTVIDSVLTNVNTNITTKIAYTNSLLNNTKLTISNKLSIMNSTLNSLNVNLTTKINLVETSISNLNINDTTRFDILNSSLHSLTINDSQYFSLLNTSIVNMNFSVKSYFNLVNDSIHGLNLTLLQKVNILKSMLNNTNITMVQKFDMISSLIGTANININQSLIFSRDLIVQMELAYKLNIALNDYVMSGGSGIIYTSDGTFVSAYTNVLDPYEVIYATTYSNLTTNESVIWFGNPTPYNVLSSIVIQGTPQIDLIGTLGKVNVSYYNLATGKTLVSYTIYNMSSNQYSISLSKTYLADGYAVKLNFSNTKNLSLTSHVTWSGNSDFTWALNNITKTYSYTAKLPANKGYYGNVNTSTLGTTMNTTNQTENVLVGFPVTVPVDTASVQVKDAQTGLYLTEGVNYVVSSNGVVFALNNYSARQYYITFKAQTNVSSDITQHLILGNPQSISAGASPLGVPSEYATAPFTNQQSVNNIYNFYLTAPTSNSILKAEVVINGVVVPANQVSIMGNLVFVSGIPIDSQQSVTIGVYYYAPTSSVTSLLFVNLIPSAPFAITPWLLVGFAILGFALIIVYNNDTNMSKIDGRGRRAVSAKDVNRYRGMMGIMFVFGLVWFIVMMLHLQGMI